MESLYYALTRKRARLTRVAASDPTSPALPDFESQWGDWMKAAATGEGALPALTYVATSGGPGESGAAERSDGAEGGGGASLAQLGRAAGAASRRGAQAPYLAESLPADTVDASVDDLLEEMRDMHIDYANRNAAEADALAALSPEADSVDGSAEGFAIDPRNLTVPGARGPRGGDKV